MLIPNTTMIGGLPFKMTNEDPHLEAKGWANESHMSELSLSIRSSYSNKRALVFYFNMVVEWTLHLLGWKSEEADKFRFNLGSALYFLCMYNRMDWVIDPTKTVPVEFNINGVYYPVNWGDDVGLKARECLGECEYMSPEIRILTSLPWSLRNWVIIHELTHAMLYESNFYGDENDEKIILPLGTLLYNFLKDNPTIVAYPQHSQNDVDKSDDDIIKFRTDYVEQEERGNK